MSLALHRLWSFLVSRAAWLSAPIITIIARILVVEYSAGFAYWYLSASGLKDHSGTPLGADFLNVYAAGVMAGHGQAAQIYDWHAHGLVEQTVAGYPAPYFAWHYPPMFLALATILALLPYLSAFAVYMAATFAGYVVVLRQLAGGGKNLLWPLAAFPGVFVNLSNGQNGFLTTLLFGGGVLWLQRQPWLAGAIFGLLAYKPQFFVVIPVILAVGGYYRAALSAIATATLSVALSWLAFGSATWQGFFASARLTRIVVEQGTTGWQKIQSVFAMIRSWGGDVTLAYTLQTIAALAALGVTAVIWRRKPDLSIRASALCAAMLLTTPYLLDYDLVILAVPLALLARQGIAAGFLPYEKIMLAGLALLPLLARHIGTFHIPLTPPLLMMLLALCGRRAFSAAPALPD